MQLCPIVDFRRFTRRLVLGFFQIFQPGNYTSHIKMYLPIIACFILLAWPPTRTSASKKINFTRLLEEALLGGSEYRGGNVRYESPLPRDTSYLPESDYVEDYEIEQPADQSQQLDRHDRNLLPEYRSLCEIMTRKVQMSDAEFEYQPPHYHEVFCKSYSLYDQTQRNPVKPAKQRCAHPGFHCVQRSRTLFMVRRRWDGDCWEPFTKEVASGCDCMWPVSSLGEIAAHY